MGFSIKGKEIITSGNDEIDSSSTGSSEETVEELEVEKESSEETE